MWFRIAQDAFKNSSKRSVYAWTIELCTNTLYDTIWWAIFDNCCLTCSTDSLHNYIPIDTWYCWKVFHGPIVHIIQVRVISLQGVDWLGLARMVIL